MSGTLASDDAALRSLLDDVLAEAETALAANPEADDAPERSLVVHGQPHAVDCEQLTVHLVRVLPRLLDDPRQGRCTIAHQANIEVRLWRCWPTGTDHDPIPSADKIETAARQLAADAWALWKGLTRAWVEGSWPAGVPCKQVKWGTLEPLPPQGGYAGWRLDVTVQL